GARASVRAPTVRRYGRRDPRGVVADYLLAKASSICRDRISLPTDSAVALPEIRFLLPRCYHSDPNQDERGESAVSQDPRFSAGLGLPGVAQFRPDRAS